MTEGDSKALKAKLQQSITSNFKASIVDLLTKLDWLPLSNTQRASLLRPVGPIARTLAFFKYVKLEGVTSILPTAVGTAFADRVVVHASLNMER